jgi:hypothetical protein
VELGKCPRAIHRGLVLERDGQAPEDAFERLDLHTLCLHMFTRERAGIKGDAVDTCRGCAGCVCV